MSFLPQSDFPLWKAVAMAGVLSFFVVGAAALGKASPPPNVSAISPRFAIADFDGDSRPDVATIEVGQVTASRAKYWILLEMSAGPRQFVVVIAPVGGLEIAPRDVNGDNVLDLIVTTPWLNQPVAVLLNDGHGNFTVYDPAAFSATLCRCKTALCPADVEIKDVTAALSRAPGDCELCKNGSPDAVPSANPVFDRSAIFTVFPAVTFFGRAPPFLVLHV